MAGPGPHLSLSFVVTPAQNAELSPTLEPKKPGSGRGVTFSGAGSRRTLACVKLFCVPSKLSPCLTLLHLLLHHTSVSVFVSSYLAFSNLTSDTRPSTGVLSGVSRKRILHNPSRKWTPYRRPTQQQSQAPQRTIDALAQSHVTSYDEPRRFTRRCFTL